MILVLVNQNVDGSFTGFSDAPDVEIVLSGDNIPKGCPGPIVVNGKGISCQLLNKAGVTVLKGQQI